MSSLPTTFADLGLAPDLLQQLDRLKLINPTPIQAQAIPIALEGKDVIGIAQTGTGKTLAFALPIIQRLAQLPEKSQALVVLPTRELAEQVQNAFLQVVPRMPTVLIIGGAPAHRQIQALRYRPKVVIATPGRLIDLMQTRSLHLQHMAIVVLDEADRMFDMGFAPQIHKIMAALPPVRQMMLFSATMEPEVGRLATRTMQLPLRIEVAPAGTANAKVFQELFVVPRMQKTALLEKILQEYRGTILIFSRTKHGAHRLSELIATMGHSAAEIHSNRSLSQRRAALAGFKSGRYRVLVATDIAARGIDVTGIQLVINFDLPENLDDYVHRIGRTGRAGQEGKAISFATPDQMRQVQTIRRVIAPDLRLSKLPGDLPPVRAEERPAERPMERPARTERFPRNSTASRPERKMQPYRSRRR